MFALGLWAGFVIGIACAWGGRWYITLAAASALSIASFVAAIGYLGGVTVLLLLRRPKGKAA